MDCNNELHQLNEKTNLRPIYDASVVHISVFFLTLGEEQDEYCPCHKLSPEKELKVEKEEFPKHSSLISDTTT